MNFTIDKEKTSKYATNFLQEKILEEPFSLKTVLKIPFFILHLDLMEVQLSN